MFVEHDGWIMFGKTSNSTGKLPLFLTFLLPVMAAFYTNPSIYVETVFLPRLADVKSDIPSGIQCIGLVKDINHR